MVTLLHKYEEMEVSKKNKLHLMFSEKCPHCGTGKVFYKPKSFFDVIPHMKASCENCGYHYEREPGFYQGAMFVSYGIGLIQGIIVFFLLKFCYPDLSEVNVVGIIGAVIVVLSMRNFKLSRMIWLYLFPK